MKVNSGRDAKGGLKLSLTEAFQTDYLESELGDYLLSNYLRFDKYGDIKTDELPTYRDLVDEFDDRLTRQDYRNVINTINNSNVSFYLSDDGPYIELSDNQTLWEIDSEIDDEDYWGIVDNALAEFENETGVTPHLLGRSGRHVCVDINWSNFTNYDELVKVQRRLEKEVIDKANNFNGGE